MKALLAVLAFLVVLFAVVFVGAFAYILGGPVTAAVFVVAGLPIALLAGDELHDYVIN